jgi:hypothetical protein
MRDDVFCRTFSCAGTGRHLGRCRQKRSITSHMYTDEFKNTNLLYLYRGKRKIAARRSCDQRGKNGKKEKEKAASGRGFIQ